MVAAVVGVAEEETAAVGVADKAAFATVLLYSPN
jgi:hypothetical protein